MTTGTNVTVVFCCTHCGAGYQAQQDRPHRFKASEVSDAKCAETRFTHGTATMTTLIGRPSKQYLCAARKVGRKSPPSKASRQPAFQLPVQGRARYHFCARSLHPKSSLNTCTARA